MATKMKKSARKKTARPAKRRVVAKKKPAMRASARKTSVAKAARPRRSTVERVKRVTREVVQQASVAMAAGVETLKDLGENLVDRVRA